MRDLFLEGEQIIYEEKQFVEKDSLDRSFRSPFWNRGRNGYDRDPDCVFRNGFPVFAIVASDEDTVKAEGEALPPPEPFPGEKIPETFPQAADIPAPSTDVSEIVEEAMPTVVAVASTAVYQTPDYGYSWFSEAEASLMRCQAVVPGSSLVK